MRNIKTALAVMVCYIISLFWNVNPFFSCTASVVSMQSRIDDSFEAAARRILATIIGAVVGLLIYFLDSHYLAAINLSVLSTGLGVIVLIFLMNLFKRSDIVVPSVIVMFSIMFLEHETGVMIYSIKRVLDTFLGIVVALIINKTIAPPKEYWKD